MIRKFLERASRERVLRRHLPDRFSRAEIFVSPDSALSYWRHDLSRLGKELFDFADTFVRPGNVVWDVGANVGLFAFAALERAGDEGRVVAFEPDLFMVSLLRRTARSTERTGRGVEVVPVAISHELDVVDFHVAERGRSSSHLEAAGGNSQSGGYRERVQVAALTLDWVTERRPCPDVVKIDVEGAEINVLEGASHLLREGRPVLLVEVGAAHAERATELLRESGYTLYDWESRERTPVTKATFSTLALPSERSLDEFLS